MNLTEYLKRRLPGNSNALSRLEALALGISYPLVTGWPKRYGDIEITEEKFRELRQLQRKAKDKQESTKTRKKEKKLARLNKFSGFISGPLKTNKQQHIDEIKPHITQKNYSHPLLGKPEYKTFYQSKQWRQLRYLALKNTNATCQCCGAKSSDGVQLHVDHIKPRSRYPELELSLDNLQVLCEDCNIGKGAWDTTDWR
jgi:hypothetical protein